jgi:RNA ligase (TIGR02306 family)
MAFFGVTIEEIGSIDPIEGADRIVKATLKNVSFSFVVGKGLFNVSDKVLYFPIDALIPLEVQRKLGVEGKLSGKDKNLVRTVKLKNTISQGVVGNLSLIDGLADTSPESITQFLGVTKYEPPEVICKGGKLLSRHVPGVPYYDIESTDRYYKVADKLMNIPCMITCKIEGSNWYGGVTEDGTEVVGQRNGQIIKTEDADHTWWSTAKSQNLLMVAKKIQDELYPGKQIILRGELTGPKVQGNYYNLVNFQIFIFDIMINNIYISAKEYLDICSKYNIQTVPILAKNVLLKTWLNGKTIKEAANGKSVLIDKLREGIVIKPMDEIYDEYLGGRTILKQRSVEYLLKADV